MNSRSYSPIHYHINENLQSASSALQLARDELNFKRAGATVEQIQLQKLQVQQSQANRDTIMAQLNKTVLFSPMTGLVTKVDFEIGEIVSPNTPVIHMIFDNQYKIEVNVPEVEIAKIQPRNQATVTLDAYGESIDFNATVALIDPSETIIDGVPTYKTTLFFTQ
ncbi:MAG: Secretion protein HlyD family protein [Parcubacteria group bacterium GW2011_GWB1_46_8]|nr:MAG: Secretion protein HlyD family protein [Parcubacteria group bacterium GW2011_GWF1_45_5]KKU44414.1 MAG: Secretion protein HlyD family protein [Parcubacteria group bacterium GW2011_GWA2_46_7]KKU46330.1 MAG: Secretion protein HlyD family protein [Parcubacteria group bacterium GW2011_GWB1_46_8]KKU47075.1 MAG: Secretion protein HlyD family protein [Parcubacteria group bacterium GW2011_GWF2_46_8]